MSRTGEAANGAAALPRPSRRLEFTVVRHTTWSGGGGGHRPVGGPNQKNGSVSEEREETASAARPNEEGIRTSCSTRAAF